MNSEISKKQLEANKLNSKKGGVKTESGKKISSSNSLKHGVLSHRVFPDESDQYQEVLSLLVDEVKPSSVLESVLLERVTTHILQLQRVSIARNEFLIGAENPRVEKDAFSDLLIGSIQVVEEGYEPLIKPETIDMLLSLYHRYEVSVENRLYKAIKELRNLGGD